LDVGCLFVGFFCFVSKILSRVCVAPVTTANYTPESPRVYYSFRRCTFVVNRHRVRFAPLVKLTTRSFRETRRLPALRTKTISGIKTYYGARIGNGGEINVGWPVSGSRGPRRNEFRRTVFTRYEYFVNRSVTGQSIRPYPWARVTCCG